MSRLDPLLAAGVNNCPTCRALGYPTTAVWLGDDLVLATYAAPCDHYGESTQLVVPSELASVKSRCAGWTAAGTPCRSWPRQDSRYCAAHDRQNADRSAR